MPGPFTWDDSGAFAHAIDGYGVAGGGSECQDITNGIADFDPDPDDRLIWCVHLWVALFGEHRRVRHGGGYPPTGDALLHKNVL